MVLEDSLKASEITVNCCWLTASSFKRFSEMKDDGVGYGREWNVAGNGSQVDCSFI